jgi:hypothetical protein
MEVICKAAWQTQHPDIAVSTDMRVAGAPQAWNKRHRWLARTQCTLQHARHSRTHPPPAAHLLLKVVVLLPHVLHELPNGTLAAAAQLAHGKGAQLVQLHDGGHGREDEAGIQGVTHWSHRLDNLVCQLLDENQRADEQVGCRGGQAEGREEV